MYTQAADLSVGDKVVLTTYPRYPLTVPRMREGGVIIKITKTRVIVQEVWNAGTEQERVNVDRWVIGTTGDVRNRESASHFHEPYFYAATDPQVAIDRKRGAYGALVNRATVAAARFGGAHGSEVNHDSIGELIAELTAIRDEMAADH